MKAEHQRGFGSDRRLNLRECGASRCVIVRETVVVKPRRYNYDP